MKNVKDEQAEKKIIKNTSQCHRQGVWHIRILIIANVFIGIRAKERYKQRFEVG